MFSTPLFSSDLDILRGQRKKTHVNSGKIVNIQRICAFLGEYILSTRVSFELRSQRTWRAYMAEKAWAHNAMELLSYFVQFFYGWVGYSAYVTFTDKGFISSTRFPLSPIDQLCRPTEFFTYFKRKETKMSQTFRYQFYHDHEK